MQKTIAKRKTRDAETATRVKRTAELRGCSVRHVYRVILGDRQDEEVMNTYMFLAEGEKSLLIQAIEKLIPIN
jgi:hypothetical protein